jgi:isochorismate hydrolase
MSCHPGDLRFGDEAEEPRLTTLANRPHTALVVIDVQNGVVGAAYDRDRVVANIKSLVDKARSEGVPVVWVQHSDDNLERGTEAWQYVSELSLADAEPVVHKSYADSFEGTDFEDRLAERGVGRLVVTGAQTDECIRSTIHGAFVRGYDVTLVGDAHTTEDLSEYGAPSPEGVIAHTNLYWNWHSAPGRKGGTVNTAEVRFTEDPD